MMRLPPKSTRTDTLLPSTTLFRSHAFRKDAGRAEYVGVSDDEALAAFHLLAKTEGILAALESSHAIAQAIKLARDMPKDAIVLCNLSGRGDKDVHTIDVREGMQL